MALDLINKHVAKILLAVQPGDSINRVSEKTGTSYAYTHQWIERLEAIGVITREDGIQIEDEDFAESFRDTAKTVVKQGLDVDDAYLLPNFAGMEYRYAKTDAAYIWTKGGYQIGRNQEDYPVFIDVHEDDVEEWKQFLSSFGVDYEVGDRSDQEQGIHYVLNPRPGFESEWSENASVTPLDETVEWMQENRASFQPALEMVDQMYDLALGVNYREREVMVD